jgi:hypothetical protein
MMTLSARFGISDVALKKTCARARIPTPERGYWAKKDAGKEVFQAAFPLRPPGMSDEVEIGGGGNTSYSYRTEEDLLAPIGAPPEFSEPIGAVRARIAETVGHITVPHKVLTWHPAIDRLLKEDERRREKQLPRLAPRPARDVDRVVPIVVVLSSTLGANQRAEVSGHELATYLQLV